MNRNRQFKMQTFLFLVSVLGPKGTEEPKTELHCNTAWHYIWYIIETVKSPSLHRVTDTDKHTYILSMYRHWAPTIRQRQYIITETGKFQNKKQSFIYVFFPGSILFGFSLPNILFTEWPKNKWEFCF